MALDLAIVVAMGVVVEVEVVHTLSKEEDVSTYARQQVTSTSSSEDEVFTQVNLLLWIHCCSDYRSLSPYLSHSSIRYNAPDLCV